MRLSLFIFLSFLFLACSDSDDKKDNLNCTTQFESVLLGVKDKKDTPIALDKYQVLIDGEDVTLVKDFSSFAFQQAQKYGKYTIVDDSMIDVLLNRRVKAHINGFIREEKVFETTIEVSSNECHVFSLDDKLEIIFPI